MKNRISSAPSCNYLKAERENEKNDKRITVLPRHQAGYASGDDDLRPRALDDHSACVVSVAVLSLLIARELNVPHP
jgi:hypothetical protein